MPEDFTPGNMDEARVALDYAELVRLLCLSAHSRRWLESAPTEEETRVAFAQARAVADSLRGYFAARPADRTLCFFCATRRAVWPWTLLMVRSLMRMGHRVIFAVKEGFYFFAPTVEDMVSDPAVQPLLQGGIVLPRQQPGQK